MLFFYWKAVLNNQKLPFPLQLAFLKFNTTCTEKRQQACPFPAGMVSLVSGEVKHVVHLIRWNLKAVICPCG